MTQLVPQLFAVTAALGVSGLFADSFVVRAPYTPLYDAYQLVYLEPACSREVVMMPGAASRLHCISYFPIYIRMPPPVRETDVTAQ
jgi:hypothetical protein